MKNKHTKLTNKLNKYNHVIGLFFCILLAFGAFIYDVSLWIVLGLAVVITVIEFATNRDPN